MNRIMLAALLAAAAAPAPADAAEKRFTVTGFDRIQVDGPFQVSVTTGRPGSAVATGSAQALESVSLEVQGRVLRVRPNRSSWGGYPGEGAGPVTIAVTTHELRGASLSGSGRIGIDKARAMRFDLAVAGSGSIELGTIEADTLILGLLGSGRMTIGGKAKTLTATVQGTGDLAADRLVADNLTLSADTAGTISVEVTRAAKVNATGSGDVTISGSPACTVKALGSGRVRCGD